MKMTPMSSESPEAASSSRLHKKWSKEGDDESLSLSLFLFLVIIRISVRIGKEERKKKSPAVT
jgi:hypothetical protein